MVSVEIILYLSLVSSCQWQKRIVSKLTTTRHNIHYTRRFAVERYISGTDMYGCGFVKHNTNSGFVDEDLHRVTPQVFSAFSFYESRGERLVADIQGVGDLYTDPQGTWFVGETC
jgi:Alpha-kinase family